VKRGRGILGWWKGSVELSYSVNTITRKVGGLKSQEVLLSSICRE